MAKDASNAKLANATTSWVLFTVCAGLFIRLIVSLTFFEDLTNDPDAYRLLAVNWAQTGTFGQIDPNSGDVRPTAFRPPLYPQILSWLVTANHLLADRAELTNISVLLAHLLMSGLTIWCGCWCISHLTKRSQAKSSQYQSSALAETSTANQLHGAAATVMTGLLIAVDPILLRQSTLVMTETLAALLALLTWAAWLKWSASIGVCKRSGSVWFAVMLGMSLLSIYCRPTALVWATAIAFSILISRKLRFRESICLATIFSIGIAIGLMPWVWRNQTQLSRPLIATSHGGYTLLLANNNVLYDHLESDWSRDWDEEQFASRWKFAQQNLRLANRKNQIAMELVEDDAAKQMALEVIRDRRAMFVQSGFIRLAWLWSLWPDSRQASLLEQVLIGTFYGVIFLVFLLSSVSIIRGRTVWMERFDYWPVLGLVLSLSVVHAVFWSNMRMRAVALPLMHVCVGLYFSDWVAQFWIRRKINSRSM